MSEHAVRSEVETLRLWKRQVKTQHPRCMLASYNLACKVHVSSAHPLGINFLYMQHVASCIFHLIQSMLSQTVSNQAQMFTAVQDELEHSVSFNFIVSPI